MTSRVSRVRETQGGGAAPWRPRACRRQERLGTAVLLAAALLFSSGCEGTEGIEGTSVRFELGAGIWDSPFPSAHWQSDGRVRLPPVPNPSRVDLIFALQALLRRDATGFGVSSTIYLSFDGPLDPSSLPELADTVRSDAPVQLVDVDPASPERGRRFPLQIRFLEDGGPFGAPNMLALQPLQGIPLREDTLYAAVVTRAVRDAAGARLGVPKSVRVLMLDGDAEAVPPTGRSAFETAARAIGDLMNADDVAALTAFRTGHPTRGLQTFVTHLRQAPKPELVEPFRLTDRFDAFCTYESEIEVPVFQGGRPPYSTTGGGWVRDADGEPEVQARARSRVVLTIPNVSEAPSSGFPLTLFIRTGGGGDRPLVDRGVRASPGGPAIEPGTGPAQELARSGWAGLSWDGPHGGLRSRGGDEQFLVFNFSNPEALRDNIRQTALEATWLLGLVDEVAVTSTSCGPNARLDGERIALMGHSMGATIAPLAAAFEPRFQAMVLSGAGGSWIQNVIYKEQPILVRPFAELLLGYDLIDRTLDPFDPGLALLQWAGEPADPPIYSEVLRSSERHVLMFQGIEDRYIPPEVAGPLAIAAGLDLAGPQVDDSYDALLSLVDRTRIDLPAQGNLSEGGQTGVVTQHLKDPVEDGHEVMFQTDAPKAQYRCFLRDIADGRIPTVPASECE